MRRKGLLIGAAIVLLFLIVATATDGFGGVLERWLLALHGVHGH
jgi:hypothetical protein